MPLQSAEASKVAISADPRRAVLHRNDSVGCIGNQIALSFRRADQVTQPWPQADERVRYDNSRVPTYAGRRTLSLSCEQGDRRRGIFSGGVPTQQRSVVIWSTHPVTSERFDDFLDVVNPNRRTSHCFCVPHRLRNADVRELGGGDREEAMRALCRRDNPPGIVAYQDERSVGWCNVGARSDMPKLVHSKLIRPIDDVPVWSIVCLVVRGGHRRQGVTGHLIEGAVEYAASRGAPAVEAYPVDPDGRMDMTMAFVGTRSMFERAGFDVVGQTDAMASKMPRLIMRRQL